MASATDIPLDVVVRFSTSNPDLIIRIDTPGLTTCLSLKQHIRSHLEPPASTSRLRLIHSGKVLQDTAALSNALTITFPPPNVGREDNDSKSEKAKGKLPVKDGKPPPAARVYVHCSIGDALTPADISAEVTAAQEADAALVSKTQFAATSSITANDDAATKPSTTTTPAPRGFDRLLSAGFTQAEIATLRTQFLAIQSHSHTPDTMPTGAQLLALEERWLDNPSTPNTASAEDANGEDSAGLEDMLYGNLVGFFWPIGAMFWLMREEGVWSRRKQIAVLSGFVVNLGFGVLRVMN